LNSFPTPTEPGALIDSAVAGQVAWRRLDPRMLLVHPLRETARLLPVLFGVLLFGSSTGRGGLWSLIGLGIGIALGLLRWFTTTYRVAGERVEVRRGLVQRRVLSVPLDRVRTVDISASALHRLIGLVRVTVGTGLPDQRGHRDLLLDGMTPAEAIRLRAELLHREGTPAAEPTSAEQVIVAAPATWAWYGPFTLSGSLTILAILGFAWRIISELHLDPRRLPLLSGGVTRAGELPWPAVAGVGLAALVMAVTVASAAGYLLAFWGFQLARLPDGTIRVTRGLISTRSTTVEERRLRGVEISEPLLLRMVRGGRCIAIATGLRVGRGANRGGSVLLPPGPRAEAQRVAAAVLRSSEPVSAPLVPHGKIAQRRRYTRFLAVGLPLAAVLLAFHWVAGWPASTWIVLLLVVPLGAALAHDRYQSLGHALAGGFLVSRWGSLVRRRSMLACDGIIGWNLEQSFFQRRAGLATLAATTAAGRQRYAVQDIPLEEAVRLADQAVPGLLTPFLPGEPGARSAEATSAPGSG
jgi:putative membrane protein